MAKKKTDAEMDEFIGGGETTDYGSGDYNDPAKPEKALTEAQQKAADLKAEQDRMDEEVHQVRMAAKEKLAAAQAALDEAKAEFDATEAEIAATLKELEQQAVLGQSVLLDTGDGINFAVIPLPLEFRAPEGVTTAFAHPRSFLHGTTNVEHVSTTDDGIWRYRRM